MGPNVSAILLAAGSSTRMGRPKPLLPLGDKPIIRHCLDTLVAADIRDVVVVVSLPGNGIVETLRGLPVTMAVNDMPESDMADSVRTGLRALDGSPSGILVCLSDHPLVSEDTVMAVIEQHHKTPDAIIIPAFQGKRGHPTLFPNKILTGIFSGITLRDIIKNNSLTVLTIEVDDEGVLLDMDTEEDYRMIAQKSKSITSRLTCRKKNSAQ